MSDRLRLNLEVLEGREVPAFLSGLNRFWTQQSQAPDAAVVNPPPPAEETPQPPAPGTVVVVSPTPTPTPVPNPSGAFLQSYSAGDQFV